MNPKTISKIDEEIFGEMLSKDFVVRMLPKRRYKILIRVRAITKGEPRLDSCCEQNRKRR